MFPYLPSFRHGLVDLTNIQDHCLSSEPRLRAHLKALKYALRPELGAHLNNVLAEIPLLKTLEIELILTYFDRARTGLAPELILEVLQRLVPGRVEEIVGSLFEPYLKRGREEGRVEGRAEGEATALIRLLERRFGALPVALRQRILAADLAAIGTWFDRAIDAPELEAVFTAS